MSDIMRMQALLIAWERGPMRYPKEGERIRDAETGRVGTATGEAYITSPPHFRVTWEDGTDGSIWGPLAEWLTEGPS